MASQGARQCSDDPDWTWRQAFFDMLWSQGERGADFAHPGWSVYRNTTQWGCLSALAANYPALSVLTGAQAFGVLARAYLQTHRPTDARLLHFGSDLPDFLSRFEPAAQWPHLVDVAWLDRLWIESHVAANAPVLTASDVLEAGLQPQAVCLPHPGARWRWSDHHPLATLWLDARDKQPQRKNLDWSGEGLLLTRPDGHVQSSRLSLAGACFLDACQRGETLEQALTQALQADALCDLGRLVAHMLEQGALAHPEFHPPGEPHENTAAKRPATAGRHVPALD